jgi:hypothetical protein
MMTFCALHPQEAMLQSAAFEVVGKFLLYAQGQVLDLRVHHIPEYRVVPLDDVIEKRLLRSMTLIGWAVWRPLRDRCSRHIALPSLERPIFSQCSLSV